MSAARVRYFIPLAIFLVLVILLWCGLKLDPRHIPSPFVNKALPAFSAPDLTEPNKRLTLQDLAGQVFLVHVWATWCNSCQAEHMMLLDIARQNKIAMMGLSYKDEPQAAQSWLNQYGNPYQLMGLDEEGRIAIDWGVYGTPETFIIDQQGIVRYKQVGPLTRELWQQTLLPLITKLQSAGIEKT